MCLPNIPIKSILYCAYLCRNAYDDDLDEAIVLGDPDQIENIRVYLFQENKVIYIIFRSISDDEKDRRFTNVLDTVIDNVLELISTSTDFDKIVITGHRDGVLALLASYLIKDKFDVTCYTFDSPDIRSKEISVIPHEQSWWHIYKVKSTKSESCFQSDYPININCLRIIDGRDHDFVNSYSTSKTTIEDYIMDIITLFKWS